MLVVHTEPSSSLSNLLMQYPDLKPPTSPIPSQPSGSVGKVETVSKVEVSAESTPEISSAPKPEVTAEARTGITRPLSPYPNVSFSLSQ